MADEDRDERTESPTARRLGEALSEGRIARSTDLVAAAGLLGGLLTLQHLGGSLLERLRWMLAAIGEPTGADADELLPWIVRVLSAAAAPLLQLMGMMVAIALLVGLLQTGGRLAPSRLQPHLNGLNPLNGLKRLGSTEALQRLGMGLVKLALVGTLAYATFTGQLPRLLCAGEVAFPAMLGLSFELIYNLALKIIAMLFLLALIDYTLERWRWWTSLKMTKQEVKDELKQMDGDPKIKLRRRQAHARLVMQRMRMDVPKADVVVSNPTHYAVALKYDEKAMAAPRVVAKGQDYMALQIRLIAQQAGVPIVQRPPLARALYAAVDVGQEVPQKFYRAIAEVLAYVYQLTRRVG